MAGGDGDDTIVWNNGDGTDTMHGEAGFDTRRGQRLAGAGDVVQRRAQRRPRAPRPHERRAVRPRHRHERAARPQRVRRRRHVHRRGRHGRAARASTSTAASGNDTLTAAEGDDVVSGGSGNDTLTGGWGYDLVDGGDGDDTLRLLDGKVDLGFGGPGNDTALADRKDTLLGVETATQPKPLTLLNGVAPVKQGAIWMRVRCDSPGGCAGRLHVTTAGAVRVGPLRAQVVLGDAGFTVGAGKTKLVRVTLAPGARALAVKRILVARVTAQVEGGYGYAKVARTVAIAFPKYR